MKKHFWILTSLLLTQASFANSFNQADISKLRVTCVVTQEYLRHGDSQKHSVSYAYEAFASDANEISRLVDVSAIQFAANGNDKIKLNNQQLLIKSNFGASSIPTDENGMPLIQLTILKDGKKAFSTLAASGKELNIQYVNNGFAIQIKKCEYEEQL